MPYLGATVLGVDVPAGAGLGFAVVVGAALGAAIVNYTKLQNAEILVGQCPCCEAEIKQRFGGDEPADTVRLQVRGVRHAEHPRQEGEAHHRGGRAQERLTRRTH